jgi:hypothetical protein
MTDDGFEDKQFEEIDLEFVYGDAPSRSFRLRVRDADGVYGPLILTGGQIDLVAKADEDDDDTTEDLYSYSSSVGASPKITIVDDGVGEDFSLIRVDWQSADLTAVGRGAHYYKIAVTLNSRKETRIAGSIVVK